MEEIDAKHTTPTTTTTPTRKGIINKRTSDRTPSIEIETRSHTRETEHALAFGVYESVVFIGHPTHKFTARVFISTVI